MKHFTNLASILALLALISGTAQAAIGVNGDTYSIPSDGVLLVEADGLIANDTMDDVDGSPQFVLDIASNISLSVISPPSQGSLTCPGVVGTAICQDGSFQYSVDPTAFTGVDSFTYRLEVNIGLPSYEFAEASVTLTACTSAGTVTTCWSEGGFFDALAALEDPANPYYVKHEGFEGAAWSSYRSYQDANFNWIYNGATTITSNGIDWSSNHPATNIISTSTGALLSGQYGVFDPDHGYATNTSVGECQALEAADPNGVVPEQCLPHDGFSASSASTMYAVGGYIKGSNSAANISVATNGGAFTNIGKLVTPAHQFYGIIDTNGFNSFRFHDIDGKTGQPLYIFGDDFYLVTRDVADANQAPVLGTVTNQTVAAGQLFQIDIPVSDPDNDAMAYVLSGIPTTGTGSARLLDNGNSIRIRWITPADSAGLYSVSVTATDNGYPRISSVLNFELTITPPPPTLSLPANISQEATSSLGAVVTYSATATDVTDGSLSPTCSPVSGSSFALGTTTVNCSVTNSNNLTSSGSFIVNVVDTTAPTVTAPPPIGVEASGPTTAVNLGTASATDLVDGALTPLPDNTGPFSVGIHQISWSVSDTSGNTGTALQTVTIIDSTAPSISLPANITMEATASSGAVVNFNVSGTDTVEGMINGSCLPASGSTFSVGLTTVNCSVTDAAGNSTPGSFTVSVVDTTPPQVTAPTNISAEATGLTTAVSLGIATASDLVSGSLLATANNTGPFTVGTHSIVWSATDAAGNTGTATQMVSITDTSAPVLNLPADFNVEATSAAGATVNYSASASDLVDGNVVINCTPASGSNFALGINLVNCSASDTSAHTSSGSFNITVIDTTAPIVTAPLDITLEATGTTTAVPLGTATATDLVDGSILPSPDNSGPFTVGVHTITWSATDSALNTGTATQTVTITDTGAPVLNLPANMVVEATAASGAVVNYSVTASDNVDGSLVPVCTPASGTTFALGTVSVSCSVTDSANLTTSGGFSISVVDTTAPVVTAPANITTEATGTTTIIDLGIASASDLVSGAITPTASNSGPFTVGVFNIIWSATDSANNTGTGSQTVTISDTTAPALNLPAGISQGTTSPAGATVNYTVTADDIADGSIVPACLPASGSTFMLGTTIVNCSATDSSANVASGSFNVTITDTGAPTLILPANISAEATSAAGAIVNYSASANDAIDGPLAASCLPASGSTFGLGNHMVNCSAQDLQGNISSGSFTISVIDTSAPTVTAPVDITVEATGATTSVTLGSASATDLVSGTLTPLASNSGPFSVGVHTVIWSATDAANNTGTASQVVTVTDTTVPALVLPLNLTQEATSAAGAIVNYSATANDIVDGALIPGCLPASGSSFALGTTTVSCSVTDSANLTASGSFNVTIVDTTAPVVIAPANISIEATGPTTAVVLGTATANDSVSGVLPVFSDNTGPFTVGVHSITWSATDAANNTGSATQIVTITDIGSPSLSLPANLTVEATSASGAVVSYTVTASDVVDGNLTASCTPLSGSTFALGSTIVNCSATDSSNLTTSGSFSVTVQDTTAPVLILPADINLNTTSNSGAIVSYLTSATDAVDGSVLPNCAPVSGSSFVLGTTVVNCTATDSSNNTGSGSFNVTVTSTATNNQPVANAGTMQTVSAGTSVTLDGGASYDPDGDTLLYQWSLVALPQGSQSAVINANSVIASFDPDLTGVYIAQLIVTDMHNLRSVASRVTITVINNAPVANAGSAQTVMVGDMVTLDGSLSSDLNGDALNYRWSLTVPTGSSAVLSNAASASPQFSADVDGLYTAQLIVNDGLIDSTSAATVTITAQLPVDAPPTITAPVDIRVASSGYLTPVAPGVATATDAEDGALQPVASNTGPFAPGRHEIVWSVTDSGNNTVTAIQIVEVLPLLDLPLDQQAEAGSLIQIKLNMNGFAPQYPVNINYDIAVNGVTSQHSISIVNGKTAAIDYQIPATANAGDRITFTLKSAVNAVIGANSTHTVTLINTNVAPVVDIEVMQNGVITKNIHANAGSVTVSAIIHDANQADSHTVDWSTTDNNIPGTALEKTFSFNPSSLNDGHYKIGVKVFDSGLLEAENEIYVQVTSQDFNPPAGSDSDHDGVEDVLEGDNDDDNDGIPNYLDAIDEQPEMLQMKAGEAAKWVLATQSGLSLRLGNTAQLSGLYGAGITSLELENFASLGRLTAPADTKDTEHTAIDGYIDFTIHGLSKPGQSVKLVIPLLSPVPDQAIYRKYNADTGWSNFIENTENSLSSAPGADGVCPAPGSSDYLPGLEPGDYCIQMQIQDGGPNDNDHLSNGVIADPGGLAVASAPTATTPPANAGTTSSGGGGGAIDTLLLLNMLMLLSLYYWIGIRHRIIGGVR